MIGIYKITSPGGRIYIGQSVNIDNRISSYKNLKCKNQTKLYRSLLKYTFENHNFEIIEQCNIEILNERERYWQDFYNSSSKKGLNCRLTKSNDKVGLLSNETKIKIGQGNKGKKVSLESRGKMSIAKLKMTEETKAKLRNKKLTQEHKQKLSLLKKGKKIKEETRLKLLQNNGKSKKVICTETLRIYNSANQCAIENNIKHKTLCNQLSGISKNKTTFKYV
ncbi:MAG: GIY-YIG nuclease family protein [Cytophagaceae bacterium]|nr:GIY-YIG nuclease family protein [Cytophagaceae bacterium]